MISILEDREGVLWVGTFGGGLNRLESGDPDSPAFKRYQHDKNDPHSLSHDAVSAIHQDQDGILWVGTIGGGLNKYDPTTERFVGYTMAEGLPSDSILGLQEDDRGYLWISTFAGLSRFDPQSETFRNYDASDGLGGEHYNHGAFVTGAGGKLYVGGTHGLNVFDPEQIVDNPYVPPIVVTNLLLSNRPVPIGGDSVLQQSILETEHLALSYRDHVVSFEFSALNYRSPQENRYKYRLEGFEEDWNEVGSERRFATYTNLDPGEYAFRVLGSNDDGVWNETGATLRITVTPPWWQTWWAYSLYVLTAVGSVLGYVRWRTWAAESERRALEQQVRERTHELGERVKELDCLYGISGLVERHGTSLEEILQGTAELLPPAFRYPQETQARIMLGSQVFAAGGVGTSPWVQSAGIVVRGERQGAVQVTYVGPWPRADARLPQAGAPDGGPFAAEEASLIRAVAERLGRIVERVQAETALERAYDGLERRVEERTAALAQANVRLQHLHAIDRDILAAQAPEIVARATVARTRQLVACQRVDVTLFDWAGRTLEILALDPDPGPEPCPVSGPDPERGTRALLALFQTEIDALQRGETVAVAGRASRERLGERLLAAGVRSFVAVPLLSQGKLVGSLNVGLSASDPAPFVREWEDMLRQVADQLTIAVQQARLFQQVERHAVELESRVADRTRELEVLHQVAAFGSRSLDLETTLVRALERVLDAVGCEDGAVHVLERDGGPATGGRLRLVAQRASLPGWAEWLVSTSPGEGIGGWVVEHGEPLFVADLTRPQASQGPVEARGYIGVPLRARGQSVGLLGIVRAEGQPPPSVEEISLLTSVGDQLGVVIESARLREQAEQTAVMQERERLARELHDSVTQLLYSINLFGRAGRDAYDRGDAEEGRANLARLGNTSIQAMKEMRLLLYELRLRDVEQERLVAAIERRLDAVERRTGVEAELEVEGQVDLPIGVERELFAIVQEALSNALKHAEATSVRVGIRGDPSSLTLEISDDGSGYNPQSVTEGGGMGLATMRERAERLGGTLAVSSEPGKGTTVRFSVSQSRKWGTLE